MFFAVIAPQAALMQTFGASIDDPLVDIVVRSWGMLITLIGAMLIIGAFKPRYRLLVIAVASLSKITFISLVITYGSQYLDKAGLAIGFDSLVVIAFLLYLLHLKTHLKNTLKKH
jgi:hypothetical protein